MFIFANQVSQGKETNYAGSKAAAHGGYTTVALCLI